MIFLSISRIVKPLLIAICTIAILCGSCGRVHQRWSHFYSIPTEGLQPNEVLIFSPDSTYIKGVCSPDFHGRITSTLFARFHADKVPDAISIRMDAELSDLSTATDTLRIHLRDAAGTPLGNNLHGLFTLQYPLPKYAHSIVSLTITPIGASTLQGVDEIGIDLSDSD